MGKAIRASVLVLLLACSAHAGWIQNDSPAPPPPPAQTVNVAQEPTTGSDTQSEAEADLTDVALNLLNSVLALL